MDELLRRLRLYETQGRVDWVQFESPHSVAEIKRARSVVKGPFSAMKGQLPRALTLKQHGVAFERDNRFRKRGELRGGHDLLDLFKSFGRHGKIRLETRQVGTGPAQVMQSTIRRPELSARQRRDDMML